MLDVWVEKNGSDRRYRRGAGGKKKADERTADAINDLLMTTVTNAARPLLAKRLGGMGDQNPCTGTKALVAKERRKRRSTQEKGCETAKAESPEQRYKINDTKTKN